MTDKCYVLNSKFNVEPKSEIKMGPFHLKNKDGVDFRKCHHFENILFELGTVDYTGVPEMHGKILTTS
jgi:hypothetical protein